MSTPILPRFYRHLYDAQDDEGHVVALGSTGGEGVGGLQDTLDGISCGETIAGFDGFEEALLAPFLELRAHGLTEAVRVDDQKVAGSEVDVGLLIRRIGNQAHDGAASFVEMFDLAALARTPNQDRRTVACVHIG